MSSTSTRTPFATTLRRAFAPYAATTAVEIRTAGWTRGVRVTHQAPTAPAARAGRTQDVPATA